MAGGFHSPHPVLWLSATAVVTQAGYITALPVFQGGGEAAVTQAGYISPLPIYALGAGIAEVIEDVTAKGGQVRKYKLRKDLTVKVQSIEPIDVTALQVLVDAMTGDLETLRGAIIKEAELRKVEEEILLMLELLH